MSSGGGPPRLQPSLYEAVLRGVDMHQAKQERQWVEEQRGFAKQKMATELARLNYKLNPQTLISLSDPAASQERINSAMADLAASGDPSLITSGVSMLRLSRHDSSTRGLNEEMTPEEAIQTFPLFEKYGYVPPGNTSLRVLLQQNAGFQRQEALAAQQQHQQTMEATRQTNKEELREEKDYISIGAARALMGPNAGPETEAALQEFFGGKEKASRKDFEPWYKEVKLQGKKNWWGTSDKVTDEASAKQGLKNTIASDIFKTSFDDLSNPIMDFKDAHPMLKNMKPWQVRERVVELSEYVIRSIKAGTYPDVASAVEAVRSKAYNLDKDGKRIDKKKPFPPLGPGIGASAPAPAKKPEQAAPAAKAASDSSYVNERTKAAMEAAAKEWQEGMTSEQWNEIVKKHLKRFALSSPGK